MPAGVFARVRPLPDLNPRFDASLRPRGSAALALRRAQGLFYGDGKEGTH
jgi:hypothetical protein